MTEMQWRKIDAPDQVDEEKDYLVKTNGGEWRDFDLQILKGYLVRAHLTPSRVRGRPMYVAEITDPSDNEVKK